MKKPVRNNWRSLPFSEWFNPLDRNHLEAFYHFAQKGSLPEAFSKTIPSYVHFDRNWQLSVVSNMAEMWIEERLGHNCPR